MPLEMRPEYHPRQYADPDYTPATLAQTASPALSRYILASPEHYRHAVYSWGMRYRTDPTSFRRASLEIIRPLSELQDAISQEHAAHAAYLRFATHAFPSFNIPGGDPLLLLAPSVSLLAMLLRSEAYQVDSHTYVLTALVPALAAANVLCPELLSWALMWAELFFEHAV